MSSAGFPKECPKRTSSKSQCSSRHWVNEFINIGYNHIFRVANIYWAYKTDMVCNIYWTILVVAYHGTRIRWSNTASWTLLALSMCIWHSHSFYGLILQKKNLFTKSSITKANLKYKLLPWFLPINTPSFYLLSGTHQRQVLIKNTGFSIIPEITS